MTISFNDLRIVNTKINMLPYMSEPSDDWMPITDDGGDCDSYATAKYARLVQYGWPKDLLRLATCWCFPNHEGYHCVLLVDWEDKTWVLDNRYPHPMEYDLLSYEWDKLQVAGAQQWESAK
jgi:predicted transglutaminase-like cysteine proteinase